MIAVKQPSIVLCSAHVPSPLLKPTSITKWPLSHVDFLNKLGRFKKYLASSFESLIILNNGKLKWCLSICPVCRPSRWNSMVCFWTPALVAWVKKNVCPHYWIAKSFHTSHSAYIWLLEYFLFLWNIILIIKVVARLPSGNWIAQPSICTIMANLPVKHTAHWKIMTRVCLASNWDHVTS